VAAGIDLSTGFQMEVPHRQPLGLASPNFGGRGSVGLKPPKSAAPKLFSILIGLGQVFCAGPAFAHPHVWISGQEQVVFNKQGDIVAIKHNWIFDQMYSAFVTTGLSKNGVLATRAQLAPLAKTNVDSLAEFSYFTFAKTQGNKVEFGKPYDYWLEELPSKLVALHFTLPLKTPASAKMFFTFQVYDPTYFVAFSLRNKNPVQTVNAPQGCSVNVYGADPLNAIEAKKLSEAFFANLSPGANFGMKMASRVIIACP
jgi:ABC-type uncharacterized transport system substrate-binding protein